VQPFFINIETTLRRRSLVHDPGVYGAAPQRPEQGGEEGKARQRLGLWEKNRSEEFGETAVASAIRELTALYEYGLQQQHRYDHPERMRALRSDVADRNGRATVLDGGGY
jgi:hypothetical protein